MRVTHVITRLIVGGAQENTIASVLGLRRKPGVEVQLLSGPTAGPEGSLESTLAATEIYPALREGEGGRRPGEREDHGEGRGEISPKESLAHCAPEPARGPPGRSGWRCKQMAEISNAPPQAACCGPEGRAPVRGENFESPLLTLVPELVRPVHPWKDWLALRRLTNLFRASRPDIVHTHSGKAGVLGRLAARRARVPVVIHTIHGPSFGSFQGALANFIFRAAERRAARATTHFVVVADAMKQQYLSAGIGRAGQYTRIFSGFDLAPFLAARNDPQLRARLGLAPDDVVVGKIARLFKLKGHDDLFAVAPELVRRCPRMKFLLVGDGEWRGRFEALARSTGLAQHFVFAGLVPPAAVPALIGVMDIVIHLSRREGLPRALPQALAAARPVVACDCDGAREVCFDKKTGFLVSPGDLAGLTDRLLRLANDAPLRARFGETGREFVRRHFAVEQMVEQLYALYLKLMPAVNR